MKYSYEQMQVYCNEMKATIDKMNDNLNSVNELCNKLESVGYWTGSAAQYYFQKFKKITNQFDVVYSDLQNYILYLQQVSENYSSVDRQIIMKLSNAFTIGNQE